ncbi:hypothetical protein C8R48DRAFT_616173, partial [Suillus tomentosus]
PVYLTIENISKDVQQQVSSYAIVLLSYFPVGYFDCFLDKTRLLTKYCLFHAFLMQILVTVTYGDSAIHYVWPILAAYIVDYPN